MLPNHAPFLTHVHYSPSPRRHTHFSQQSSEQPAVATQQPTTMTPIPVVLVTYSPHEVSQPLQQMPMQLAAAQNSELMTHATRYTTAESQLPEVCKYFSRAITLQLRSVAGLTPEEKQKFLREQHLVMARLINEYSEETRQNYSLLTAHLSTARDLDDFSKAQMRSALKILTIERLNYTIDMLLMVISGPDQTDHSRIETCYYNLVLFHREEILRRLQNPEITFTPLILANIFSFLAVTQLAYIKDFSTDEWANLKAYYLINAAYYFRCENEIRSSDGHLHEVIRLNIGYVKSYLAMNATATEQKIVAFYTHLGYLVGISGMLPQAEVGHYLEWARTKSLSLMARTTEAPATSTERTPSVSIGGLGHFSTGATSSSHQHHNRRLSF